jgi:hypothetical protein
LLKSLPIFAVISPLLKVTCEIAQDPNAFALEELAGIHPQV